MGLLIFVALATAYLLYMMTMIGDFLSLWCICLTGIIINLLMLAKTICGDPGIKESIYHHYIKKNIEGAKQEESPSLLESEENKPLKRENQRPQKRMRQDPKSGDQVYYRYCIKCEVELTKDMEHCSDCDVCFSEWDHHCVFFSKCIAKNN
jgi:hypothetical protein